MKKLMPLLVAVLIISSGLILPQDIKRFEFERAYIEKTIETNTAGVEIKTTKKIYITEYGNKMASYDTEISNIPMANIIDSSRSVSITDGEWVTTYDPDTNEGTKMKIPFLDTFGNMSEEDQKKFAEQMGDAMNTKVTEEGTGEVAGVTCNITKAVTDLMGMKTTTTTYMYKNYVMKITSKGNGSSVNELVSLFEEGAEIDPLKLKVSSKVNITEVRFPFK